MRLRRKIFLRIGALVTVLVVAVVAFGYAFVLKHHRIDSKKVFAAQLAVLVEGAEELVLWDDRVGLKKLLRGTVRDHEVVEYAFLVRQGKPYVHTFEEGVPRALLNLPASAPGTHVSRELEDDEGRRIFDMAMPVGNEHAVLHLGLSSERIDRDVTEHLVGIIGLALGGIAVGFILAGVGSRLITREVDESNHHLERLHRRLSSAVGEVKTLMERIIEDGACDVRFVNPSLLRCWEVKNCGDETCPVYGRLDNLRCWETNCTCCQSELHGTLAQKLKDCRACDVYQGARSDSIYELGETFNDMIVILEDRKRDVEDLNKQLVEISREAGRAETAAGVLHNVGNVLNSVNVSATLIADKVRRSKVSGVAKAANLMSEQAEDLGAFITDDEKGKQLPSYLSKLADHLADEQGAMLEELKSLTTNIEHIKQIVNLQQSYAGVYGAVEAVSVADVMEDVLKMTAPSFNRHGIRVAREYAEVPRVVLDKHKLLQILVNLVKNAKQALCEGAEPDAQLTLRIEPNSEHCVQVEVVDNGAGIAEENLTRIFSHGFTTKKDGHGFGLHSSALAAKEMGGSLMVHSDGPGKGATFALELPLEPVEVAR